MPKCKKCDKTVPRDQCCDQKDCAVSTDGGDFLLSAAVGAVTDNAAFGALFGGDILGAIVGEIFSDGDLF